jgi:hypothetical protein
MYTTERLPTDLELLAIKAGIAYQFSTLMDECLLSNPTINKRAGW